MKTQTKTVKGKYEAPECQALIFAFDTIVLSASQIKNYSTESFDTSYDDSENWN